MKNNNINLDDYFEKAKDTEPLISKDEARNLLKTRPVHSNKFSNGGFKNMHIIASIVTASAVIGALSVGNLFENKQNKDDFFVDKTVAKQEYIAQNQSREAKTTNNKEYTNITNSIRVSSTDEPLNPIEFVGEQLEVKGVNIVELSQSDLERLGIVKEDSKISFYSLTDTPFPLQVRIDKNGIKVDNPEKVNAKSKTIYPRLVTDKFGNRILSMLSMKENGGGYSITRSGKFSTDGLNLSEDDMDKAKEYSVQMSLILNQSEDANFNVDFDSLFNKLNIDENLKDVVRLDMNAPTVIQQRKKLGDSTSEIISFSFNNDSLVRYFDGEAKELKIKRMTKEEWNNSDLNLNRDILTSREKKVIRIPKRSNFKLDSVELGNRNVIILKPNKMEFDSIEINLSGVDNFIFSNDSQFDFSKLPDIDIEDLRKHDPNRMNNKLKDIRDLKLKMPDLKSSFTQMFRINKLVPVRIKLDNNSKEYLLWFDPTEEFANSLPSDLRERLLPEIKASEDETEICNTKVKTGENYFDVWRACSGAVENLNVFPNPATDNININYELTDNRTVTMTINDLFGNKIAELKTEAKTAGSHSDNIKLQGIQPGMYLIVIQTDRHETAVQRFIVN